MSEKEKIDVRRLPYHNYCSDCGDIMVGNDSFKAMCSNGYGDCTLAKVYLLDDSTKSALDVKTKLQWIGEFKGTGYVYDCDIPEDAKPLFELNGSYNIYQIMDEEYVDSVSKIRIPTGDILIVKNY